MKLCVICVCVFVLFVANFSWGHSTCKTPTLRFGRIRSRQRGKSVKFLCNLGFQLAGDRTAFCINGSWDVPIPKCVRPSCAKKDNVSPKNGVALPSLNGAVLMFYCQQGYEINGPGTIYCDGFQWDNHVPSCIPAHTKPSLFCDFESDDLCHWTQDINHDMDWVRDNYQTPTGSSMPTGPSFDHTLGAGKNGHYMYIESSSRRINDTARLISPIFGKLDGRVCLEIWYHMYGKTIGTLRAYVKKISDPWPLKPIDAIFSESGNKGNVWLRQITDMGPIPEDFQIILEGVRGNGYVSDMAVDDIRLIPNCNIDDYMETSTYVKLSIQWYSEGSVSKIPPELLCDPFQGGFGKAQRRLSFTRAGKFREFVTASSEIIKTMDTCQNRCGYKSFGNESAFVMACDCDDFCYESSRCCPDWVDMCFAAFSTTEESTAPEAITEDLARQTTRIQHLPTKSLFPSSVPRKVNTMPTIVILQPTTTPAIIEKKLPGKNDSKIAFVKPKKPTPSMTYHDDVEVPMNPLSNNEMLPVESSPAPIEDSNDINASSMQEREEDVEDITNQKDYPFKVLDESSEHVGEIKTELKQTQTEGTNIRAILLTIAIVGGVIMVGIGAGVALIKLKFLGNRRINSGQGDSQSDVRFLTADEVLDFTLDREYDDL
ncbi:hypothetical protein HUJ04_000809 [Dendroctonus ponderosae]|nr:hypothetical protein HUJ04_000809 [Dendroctonus ponderosae]